MNIDLKKAPTFKPTEKAEDYESDEYFDEDDQLESNENEEFEIDPRIGEILHAWQAPEYEIYEKSNQWYLIGAAFILFMVGYALMTNGPIMAITFILLGIVGYIHLEKDPRIITFAITSKGVLADKQLYLYENIYSFWIFYEIPHTKTISLHTKASMLPYVHIPLRDEDPVKIRELLLQSISEIKQEPNLIDTIERVLHI